MTLARLHALLKMGNFISKTCNFLSRIVLKPVQMWPNQRGLGFGRLLLLCPWKTSDRQTQTDRRGAGGQHGSPRGQLSHHPSSARFHEVLAFLFYLHLAGFKASVQPSSTCCRWERGSSCFPCSSCRTGIDLFWLQH